MTYAVTVSREFVAQHFLTMPDPGAIATAIGGPIDDRDRLRERGVAALEPHEAHHTRAETGDRIRGFLRRRVAEWRDGR